jgi:transposase
VILPARPAHPRDKPKIEVAVQIVERWILARLRHETFFSLAALNARIAELLEALHTRPMRRSRASRRALFERLDRPALRPLPAEAFIVGEWHYAARVNIDDHVELHGHYSAVPHALMHALVDTRLTVTTVELFHRGQRVAAHVRRARTPRTPPTCPRRISTIWSGPRRASSPWPARSARRPRPSSKPSSPIGRTPSRAYRSCLGILRLATRDGDTRLEAACARAVAVGSRSYRHVDSILKHGLDRLPGPMAPPPRTLMPVHEQIRGREYYQDPNAAAAPAAGEHAR